MKIKASIVIILISILLCCSIFGGAFALYSVSDSLEIPFSGKASEIVEYFLKIKDGASEIATIKLSNSESNPLEYKTTAYLKSTYKLSFYKNDTLLTTDTDFKYATGSDVTATVNPSYEFNYFVSLTTSNFSISSVNIELDRGYYLVGDNNGWSIGENAIRLETNTENASEVMILNVPFTANQGFKIRNYEGYYGSVNEYSPEVSTFNEGGDIVLRYTGNYDMYFNLTSKSVYYKMSGVNYITITSYQNSSWIFNGTAKLFARGSDGKFYTIKAKEWNYNDVTVEIIIPDTLTYVTAWRVGPLVTYDNFNTTTEKWNDVTINKSNFGNNNKIWS